MTEDRNFTGSVVTARGERVPLTPDEAKALWEHCQQVQKERAERLPDSAACLSALSSAVQRLNELGWRSGRYCPRDGSVFAVCQVGSTGMWKGFWGDDGDKHPLSPGFIHAADCVNRPSEVFFKPLASLTDSETALINRCDAEVVEFIDRLGRSFGDAS